MKLGILEDYFTSIRGLLGDQERGEEGLSVGRGRCKGGGENGGDGSGLGHTIGSG